MARLRSRDDAVSSNSKDSLVSGTKNLKGERRSASPVHIIEGSSRSQPQSRPQLVIPAVDLKPAQLAKLETSGAKPLINFGDQANAAVPFKANSAGKLKNQRVGRNSEQESVELQEKGTKRKLEHKEHQELIPLIRSSSSPCIIRCHSSAHISSQHKRKLRSIVLCPTNHQLFITSALDGVINMWQIQSRGSGASLLSNTDCLSPKQRRWPEDVAWHPQGSLLFCAYTADAGDSQISLIDLNKTAEKERVTFFENKPHVKGIINNISFAPWDDVCFFTGGSDHAVILWSEQDGGEVSWKPNTLHRHLHTSAVMGVAGLHQKQTVVSAGADKRIIGYDVVAGRPAFKHLIESKCMSVLPNPCDFHLFMVQTATPERQLRLLDSRLRQTEIHAFGWKQESSESQSALINQAWSPDGLYISSGSADPMIHIFDIRYNSNKPSQSIKAHQKRVFKAVWSITLPLLVSISSDLNIGLHKIT